MAAASNGSYLDVENEKYDLVRELGRGNFGVTLLMKHRQTQELVAVKFIQRGSKINVNVERELLNHRPLLHPHIIRFREVFLTTTHLAIVMEYASGGELFEFVKRSMRLTEDAARFFFQQLVSGIEYCHAQGVTHRDLKLENTLIDRQSNTAPRLKVCDFGYSKHAVNDSMPKSVKGTIAYLAPEVVLCNFNKAKYDAQRSDIWSCGVMLYLMLVGAYPFQDGTNPAMFAKTVKKIVTADYSFPPNVQVSDECLDLISRIFVVNPNARITLPAIKSHPWFVRNLPIELQVGGFRVEMATQEGRVQSVEAVRQIMRQATVSHPSLAAAAGPEQPLPECTEEEEDEGERQYSMVSGTSGVLDDAAASLTPVQSLGQMSSMEHLNSLNSLDDGMDMDDIPDEEPDDDYRWHTPPPGGPPPPPPLYARS